MNVTVELNYALRDMRIVGAPSDDVHGGMVVHIEWLPEQGLADTSLTIEGYPRDIYALGKRLCELAQAHQATPTSDDHFVKDATGQ